MRPYVLRALVHKELLRHLSNRGSVALALMLIAGTLLLAALGHTGLLNPGGALAQLAGGGDVRAVMASALVLFALFFTCVYLLPSLTCEERERGVLLAQALSPATPTEILVAKFFFYPALGIALAALLAGLYQPAVLRAVLFWPALVVLAAGAMGVGLTMASLAKTQRAASLGALCYMLIVSLLMTLLQQVGLGVFANLFLEYHGPRMLHAVLTDGGYPLAHLGACTVLAAGWLATATVVFRRFGWQ
jgi:hypothetical protein